VGTFRQATVYEKRNRDTEWYAVIDADWPTLQGAFEAWLTQKTLIRPANSAPNCPSLLPS
jgi:hypothetical protein